MFSKRSRNSHYGVDYETSHKYGAIWKKYQKYTKSTTFGNIWEKNARLRVIFRLEDMYEISI